MPRVLLTGGAGFIASHLTRKLLDEGFEVVGLDNFITGSKKNIEGLDSDRFSFREMDVSKSLDSVEGPFDYVLHFASPASPVDYLEHPIETLLVGSAGTHAALDCAVREKAVFMIASTSEVYGDPLVTPQEESYWGNVNPNGPRSCYDEAKRYSEAATAAYQKVHGLDARILRIFNTYGPRMQIRDGRAVTNFICQALEGQDITIHGDGSQTRSFCYVTDLVDGIVKLMLSDVTGPVNLGNPTEMTINELAGAILEHTGSQSKLVHVDAMTDDPKQRRPDITRAKTLLGWEPKVPLNEGLRLTIDYYKSELGK